MPGEDRNIKLSKKFGAGTVCRALGASRFLGRLRLNCSIPLCSVARKCAVT